MSVCSISFIIFVAAVFVVNWAIPSKYRYLWQLAASIYYYASWNLANLPVLAGVIVISYALALLVKKQKPWPKASIAGIVLLAAMLLFYKYVNPHTLNLSTPAGISFFTLVAIGYLADVSSGAAEPEHNIGKLALHIAFFPSVLSGPIESSGNLLVQIEQGTAFDYTRVKAGLRRILWGYYLKILIADRLTVIVDNGFNNYSLQTGATMAFAAVIYTIRLYADFAGYSCIVIGVGKLLGYDLIENFRCPYLAAGIRDYWSRWHISLSSWFKKYVYIPLGGSRRGSARTMLNLLITFIVSGIWHGSGWQFIFWGVLHACYQIAGRLLRPGILKLNSRLKVRTDTFSYRLLCTAFTFCLITAAGIFFRSDSVGMGLSICRNILLNFRLGITLGNRSHLLGFSTDRFPLLLAELGVVIAVDALHEKGKSISAWLHSQNKIFEWGAYLLLCFAVMLGAVYNYGASGTEFLYTRF